MQIATLLRRTKFPRGSALLEAVLAIGVLMVGVVGTLVLIITTINLGRANQDRIVAQNLAREGMELAYAHRNAGALSTVEFPNSTWDSYLFARLLKTNAPSGTSYLDKFDLGEIDEADGNECKFLDTSGCDAATYPDPDVQARCIDTSSDDHLNSEEAIICDLVTLVNYMFVNLDFLPPGCDDTNDGALPYWDGSDTAHSQCNFSGDDDMRPDIGDLTYMIYELLKNAFQYQAAYPTVGITESPPRTTLQYFMSPSSTDITTGEYPLQEAWDNTVASRVYEVDGTFSQNVPPPAGAMPTKFYRVVTFQPVCRGRASSSDPYEEWVVNQNSANNCRDDAQTKNGWVGAFEATKIGILVTSEVRWPTPDSRTRVTYQEYLYDWINL